MRQDLEESSEIPLPVIAEPEFGTMSMKLLS